MHALQKKGECRFLSSKESMGGATADEGIKVLEMWSWVIVV